MNTKAKRNNRKRNKGGQQAQKGGESDNEWEEMLKKPLPEENSASAMSSSLSMAQMVMAAASLGVANKTPSAEFTPKK